MTTRAARHALKVDAKNRAWRTLLQGLGFSVASALVVALWTAVTTSASWGELGLFLSGCLILAWAGRRLTGA